MAENNGADVTVKVAGQEVNLRNVKSLNTLLTAATFIVVVCGFTVGWTLVDAHRSDAKAEGVALAKRDDALSGAIKDMAQSNRVLACLMATPQDQREAKLAQCERIAR